MSAERLRVVMVGLFVVAAVLSVLGNKSDQAWVSALSYTLFALGVTVYLRWRLRVHAKVLASKEKTTPDREETTAE